MSAQLLASFEKRYASGPTIRVENLAASASSGITVLFGASGCGKTTILRCLAGLEIPDAGHVSFAGEVWSDAQRRFFLPARARNLGFVPQDYALFPHLSVAANIAYGLIASASAARRQRVAELLDWLGLTGLENRSPRELSGGQQQRVALARAVAGRPRLLLLDEPLSALDAPTRARLRGELRGLLRQLGVATVLVTHDRHEALVLGDELVVLHEGGVVQQGPVSEVFSRPRNLAAAGILAVETVQPGQVLGCQDGLATVAVNSARLTAVAQDLPEGTVHVFVCIRAEDVTLTVGDEPHSSPRNRLPGVVRRLDPEGPLIRATLDCGFPLLALITKAACAELALREGAAVCAVLKAPQVHLIPRDAA